MVPSVDAIQESGGDVELCDPAGVGVEDIGEDVGEVRAGAAWVLRRVIVACSAGSVE